LRASRNLRMVARLDGILEDEIDSVPARDAFWHQVRKKLGKLRRLSQSDIWQIEIMVSARIAKPQPGRSRRMLQPKGTRTSRQIGKRFLAGLRPLKMEEAIRGGTEMATDDNKNVNGKSSANDPKA